MAHTGETMDDVNVHFPARLGGTLNMAGGDDIEVKLIEGPANHASDYYPFGLVMDGRSWSSEPYRFGYQGQFSEYDEETGWNAFELRMYDSKIGRWLSVDPKRIGFSPYIGMSNNPLDIIDPDGGGPLDIFLTGTDGKTLQVKAPGDHIYKDVPFAIGEDRYIDIGLQHIRDLAIGFEHAVSLNGQVVGGGSGMAFIQNVMFFNEQYGGFWYQYGGGQVVAKLGADVDISVGASAGIFIGINRTGNYKPSAFAGKYTTFGGEAGPSFFAEVRGYYQYSRSEHWHVHEIGAGVSAGAQGGAFSGFGGLGTLQLLNDDVKMTKNRSWADIIVNHTLFNPISPVSPY